MAAVHELAKIAGIAVDEHGERIPGARFEGTRVSALNALLDRAVGKPAQAVTVEGDAPASSVLQHLLAARAISAIGLAEQAAPAPVIEGVASPSNGADRPKNGSPTPRDIFTPALE